MQAYTLASFHRGLWETASDLQMELLGDLLLSTACSSDDFSQILKAVLQERQAATVPCLQSLPGGIFALCPGLMVSAGMRFLEETS